MKTNKKDPHLNSFAHSITTFCRVIHIQKGKLFEVYGGFTGTSKAYEFFSPNVPRINTEFIFLSNNGNILTMPFSTTEANIKFQTSYYFLKGHFKDEGIRNEILKSITACYFSRYPNIKCIKVYIKNTYFNNTHKYPKNIINRTDKTFAFVIKRNKL